MQELGSLDVGTARGFATDINNKGEVAGLVSTPSGYQAFLWDGTVHDLGSFGFGWNLAPAQDLLDINDNEQMTGTMMVDANHWHAFFGQGGSWQDMTPGQNVVGSASGINNIGQAVGAWYSTSGFYHAFVWQNGIKQNLGTLGRDSNAVAINEAGQIVGVSVDTAGVGHAVLWQPVVPEPSSIFVLLCGVGGLGAAVRRRRP